MHLPLDAFFHPAEDGGHRLYLHHLPPPGQPVRGAVLYFHPWAEEMNKGRRMTAMASRVLAAEGYAVLQIDLLGCGDSSGDFEDASWDAWVEDAITAARWLRRAHPDVPLWLWGLRAGALLATAAAPRIGGPLNLLFWQPALQGKLLLHQFLRLKATAQLADGRSKTILDSARAELASGRAVEVAGYTLPPRLAQGLEAALLMPPSLAPEGRVVWLEVSAQPEPALSAATQAALPTWDATDWSVSTRAVRGPAFWQTTEIEDAPELVRATIDALAPSLATSRDAAHCPSEPRLCPAPHHERPVQFTCGPERLFGVLHPAVGSTAVVVIVGGPQFRAGSHRLFVHMARTLAASGYPVLRFDVRGMGDSTGTLNGFEQLTPDIGAAIDALIGEQAHVKHVVLWGLCDGASAALLYCHDRVDPRISALCLVNPWVRSAQSLARTHVNHYYRQRLLERGFWLKLLKGKVAMNAVLDLARNLRLASTDGTSGASGAESFQQRMRMAWERFTGTSLLVLSGDDYTAREFEQYVRDDPAWHALTIESPRLTRRAVEDADHTLSGAQHKSRLLHLLLDWLNSLHCSAQPTSHVSQGARHVTEAASFSAR